MDLIKISEKYYEDMLKFTKELGTIPAPSGEEDERAEYVLAYMRALGLNDAYIDEAKNVIATLGEDSSDIVVFMAHTDIVFPRDVPLNIKEDEETLAFPGATDDVACLAVLMADLKYLKDNGLVPKKKIMFVANSCEEGLGNLKGSRQIFRSFGDRISRMYTFDGLYHKLVTDSVGSHRYEVTAITEGGHSFGKFGRTNAIAVLADIISEIYKIDVPKRGKSKTTYNVGIIEGGTSVNTIAQNARMLVEYRSDNAECLADMKENFLRIFEKAKLVCPELKVELVGDRPCKAGVDEEAMKELIHRAKEAQKRYTGIDVMEESGSTDANIPHSLGIPAVCVGVCDGAGAHTREEWLKKASLKPGFAIGLELVLKEAGLM